jgi:hypothetical protein
MKRKFKFDPSLVPELIHTNPVIDRFSKNEAERRARMETAIHEAHHLVAAVVFNVACVGAYIAPSGKSVPGRRGVIGCVQAFNEGTIPDTVSSYAGVISELFMFGNLYTPAARADWDDIKSRVKSITVPPWRQYQLTKELNTYIKKTAYDISVGYAALIDCAACVMLYYSLCDGRVKMHVTGDLMEWIQSVINYPEFHDNLDVREIFLSENGSKGSDFFNPSKMAIHRQRIDNRIVIPTDEFERFGLIDGRFVT